MPARQPGKSVLVVEDEKDTRDALTLLLEREDYCVRVAANGREALQRLRGERPDVILLDLAMPVMDGREFRRRQKRDPALASIPVVIVSAAAEVGQEAVALGAASYLDKPVDPKRLLVTVRRVCGQGGEPSP